jgi:hypothetical protein
MPAGWVKSGPFVVRVTTEFPNNSARPSTKIEQVSVDQAV